MGGEDLGGLERGKTIIRIYQRRIFFQLKKCFIVPNPKNK